MKLPLLQKLKYKIISLTPIFLQLAYKYFLIFLIYVEQCFAFSKALALTTYYSFKFTAMEIIKLNFNQG